ncbi:MAG: segregation/condensation protein A [Firmicutes bacterium]|nr:segregation/condensation protein A [Bacillota bacterium]
MESIQTHNFKLNDFEGPLDLLLHLIRNAKLDVKDIFISNITEQFLAYLQDVDALNIKKASEFLEMAATLLEIKSRTLLPQMVEEIEKEESIENKLIRQIEEYRILKEAGEKLKGLENLNRFYKQPDPSIKKQRVQFKEFCIENLLNAFQKLSEHRLEQRVQAAPRIIVKERFTVPEKIKLMREIIKERGSISFFALFSKEYTKGEIVITFLSLLELVRLNVIRAVQGAVFDDIQLQYNEEQLMDSEFLVFSSTTT